MPRKPPSFPGIHLYPAYPQQIVLRAPRLLDIVGKHSEVPLRKQRTKRESGVTPELPRSGNQVRTPLKTLDANTSGKSGK